MASFERTLKEHGVTCTDPDRVILHCDQCGYGWSPNIQRGGRMPVRYWACPNGCNHSGRIAAEGR